MSKYDKMSVEELLAEVVKLAGELGCSGNVKSVHFPALEAALRKAVIREASVGKVEVTCEDASSGWLKVQAGLLPPGDYDVIPHKETA